MRKKLNIAVTVLILSTLTACGSATGSKPTMEVNQNSNITQSVTVQPTETKYLTRAEAMSLLYKTLNPDTKPTEDSDFTAQVGTTEYNLYAQEYKGDTYLNTSENKNTYNSTMSRGEAIYLLMNRFYAEELDTYKADNVKLEDAEDKGEEQKSGKTRIEELSAMLNNPTEGVEHNLYKAIALAHEKGILDTAKTRWNEGITKAEMLELIIKVEAEFNKAGVIKGGLVDREDKGETEDTIADANIDGDDVEIPQETMDYLKNVEGKTIAEIKDKDKADVKVKKDTKENKATDNKNKKAKKKDKNKKVVENKNKVEQPKKDNANGFNQGQPKKDNNVKVEQPAKKDQPVKKDKLVNNNKQKPVKKDNTKKDNNKNKNKGGQNTGGGYKVTDDPNSPTQRGANFDGNIKGGDMSAEEVLDAIGD